MFATGTFAVDLTPQEDPGFAVGRMHLSKIYAGDLVGSSTGQMISKRTKNGAAVYYAIEEFSGALSGKHGTFTLAHSGYMHKSTQTLEVMIVKGSGGGELESISGTMQIRQKEQGHEYSLDFQL